MRIRLFFCVMLGFTAQVSAQDCVILLHGMGRTHHSMSLIEDRLKKDGYLVWNKSYPSTSRRIESLAEEAIGPGLAFCASHQAHQSHFVTHSLGGILLRYYLQHRRVPGLGRIVMLSPPNHGSEIADRLKDNYLYQKFMGPAGQELGTDAGSLPQQLKPVDAEVGVIAGDSSSDPWFSPMIPGNDDGKVSVQSTRLKEMQDFIVVGSGHSFIMRNSDAIRQIRHFLKTGCFIHIAKAGSAISGNGCGTKARGKK